MMMNDTSNLLAENVIHEFNSNSSYKLKHSTRRKNNRVILQDSLATGARKVNVTNDDQYDRNYTDSSNDDVVKAAHFTSDSFDEDLTTGSTRSMNKFPQKTRDKTYNIHDGHSNKIKSRMTKQLQPLVINDSHRIGHLMHKISAVSGDTILAGSKISTVSPIGDSSISAMKNSHSSPAAVMNSHSSPAAVMSASSPIGSKNTIVHSMHAIRSNDVSKYQLKIMQESVDLKEHIGEVLRLHDHLSTTIMEQLTHRAELAKAVGSTNDRYIELFELILSEMLKTQRLKFKVSWLADAIHT